MQLKENAVGNVTCPLLYICIAKEGETLISFWHGANIT